MKEGLRVKLVRGEEDTAIYDVPVGAVGTLGSPLFETLYKIYFDDASEHIDFLLIEAADVEPIEGDK